MSVSGGDGGGWHVCSFSSTKLSPAEAEATAAGNTRRSPLLFRRTCAKKNKQKKTQHFNSSHHRCVLLTLQLLVLPLHPLQQDLLQDGLPPQLPQLLAALSAPLLSHRPDGGTATGCAVRRAGAHSTRFQSGSRMLCRAQKIWTFTHVPSACFG